MKQKTIKRGLLGFPLGIAIGNAITIAVSLGWGGGQYYPCVPELTAFMGSELAAVVLQTVLSGLLGTAFAAASVIWEQENWSLVKQTGIYFSIVSLVMLPIAYVTYWMEHTLLGFLSYFGVYLVIFLVIWVSQFVLGRKNVKAMNEQLGKSREND